MADSKNSTAALERCPHCGSAELKPVFDGEMANFWCTACAQCWHVELGVVHRVDPHTCPGCEHRDRCAAAFGVPSAG
jgi:hypothetical protein